MASRARALSPLTLVLAIAAGCTLTPQDRTQALLPDQFHFYYETLESDVDNRGSPGRGFDQEGDSFLFGLSWDLALPPAAGITREDLRWLLLEMHAAPAGPQTPASAGVHEPSELVQPVPQAVAPIAAVHEEAGPAAVQTPQSEASPASQEAPPEPGPIVVGTVVDGRSGDPIAGALVRAPDGSEARSDDSGCFELCGLEPGLSGELVGTTDGLAGRIRLRPLSAGRLEVVLRLYPR